MSTANIHSIDQSSQNKRALLYLWKKRTLFIGRFDDTLSLSQGAATLTIALEQPFSYTTKENKQPIYCRSLIIPAGFTIYIDAHKSLIANCNLDVLGHDYANLYAMSQENQVQENQAQDTPNKGLGSNLGNEKALVGKFLHLFNHTLNSQQAFDFVDQALQPLSNYVITLPDTDPRIVTVIEHIQHTANQHITGEDLAQSVNLSIPRLAQLFKQQTGIPIRRYRLWHRLYLTAQNVGLGKNLTDAAIEAGFTDSSHFAHTFRAMLGTTPSCILSQGKNTQIII